MSDAGRISSGEAEDEELSDWFVCRRGWRRFGPAVFGGGSGRDQRKGPSLVRQWHGRLTTYRRLIDANGMLYGTTFNGGAYNDGAVFAVNAKTRVETVLYSFCAQQNCADGYNPDAALIDVKGTLYGTTFEGGAYGEGTVFALNPNNGVETVLYSFGNGADGAGPEASLIDMKGMLYGTTYRGGSHGYGTAFALNPNTGAEDVLHSFGSSMDGENPEANLVDVNGTLYGTTLGGGIDNNVCEDYNNSCGTVFSLDPITGAETVVYSFCAQQNCTDGELPQAGLVNVKGMLYGTTTYGGNYDNGTVFAINTTTGAETVLYSFCSQQYCVEGDESYANLIDVKGTLYGTTHSGGPITTALCLRSTRTRTLRLWFIPSAAARDRIARTVDGLMPASST